MTEAVDKTTLVSNNCACPKWGQKIKKSFLPWSVETPKLHWLEKIRGSKRTVKLMLVLDHLYNWVVTSISESTAFHNLAKAKVKSHHILTHNLVTDRSSVLPFCPNRTEQVNESSVFRTETEQNRTCKKRKKKRLELRI